MSETRQWWKTFVSSVGPVPCRKVCSHRVTPPLLFRYCFLTWSMKDVYLWVPTFPCSDFYCLRVRFSVGDGRRGKR